MLSCHKSQYFDYAYLRSRGHQLRRWNMYASPKRCKISTLFFLKLEAKKGDRRIYMSIKAAQERHSSKLKERDRPRHSLGVSAACDGHWPVVLCYTGPEDPSHDHCEKSEEALEKCSVDLSIRPRANMRADDILEDLSNGKE